jgi:cellulose synthase/poly-beta-1,6-N-acetylglucosamine synthase-like glycosyltransferase
LEKGYKVYLETEAIGYEEAVLRAKDEFKRKTRIVSGGINVLFYMRRLLNPFLNFKICFQLVSHKIFRSLTPLFLISLFITNAFLLREGALFRLIFILQLSCYALAVIGFLMRKNTLNIRIIKIPFYFCLVNLAAIIGIFKFLIKENKVMWEPVR